MVKTFHAAGLKVYVDMVYNHHDEGGVDEATGTIGTMYSLRGFDNPNYYEAAQPKALNLYEDDNGVGPNVNAATARGAKSGSRFAEVLDECHGRRWIPVRSCGDPGQCRCAGWVFL